MFNHTPTHRISIPAILEVGDNKLNSIGTLLKKYGFGKVILFFGDGIFQLFGEQIVKSIQEQDSLQILEKYNFDNNDIDEIIKIGFEIPAQTEVIIGIGGGKVLDTAKYISFLNNLPFISIPTSTSNDGFSSSGSSLKINGRRTSVLAKMPFGIIVDTDIIKMAPDKFIYSGIGDLISKITALEDWIFEEKNRIATVVDDFAAMIARKSVNSIIRMDFKSIKDNNFINELVDSLTMSGIAMEIAGDSAPASGSEHLISHAMDKLLVERNQLHGIQVGIATYIMSKVQDNQHQSVSNFLTRTGFFDYVKTLKIRASDIKEAIMLAPTIKPNRCTYIHKEVYRNNAIELVDKDNILHKALVYI